MQRDASMQEDRRVGVRTYPSFLQPNLEKAEVPCFRLSSPIFCSTRVRSDLGAMDEKNLE